MTTGSTINNAIKRRPHSYGEVLSSFGEENMKTLSQLRTLAILPPTNATISRKSA
jgi:hypothetical protein